jgi:hypothetical protein
MIMEQIGSCRRNINMPQPAPFKEIGLETNFGRIGLGVLWYNGIRSRSRSRARAVIGLRGAGRRGRGSSEIIAHV